MVGPRQGVGPATGGDGVEDLNGKVAVFTGGATGIGRGIPIPIPIPIPIAIAEGRRPPAAPN
jgi:hypothetical protein